MAKVLGRFYFKKTTAGNLIGEYSNSGMMSVDSEAANVVDPGQGFLGTYRSTWLEDSSCKSADLIITQKHAPNIFTIEWFKNGKVVFWGEGMLVDDILIGDYRNYQNI
jgi:hypothetical protein